MTSVTLLGVKIRVVANGVRHHRALRALAAKSFSPSVIKTLRSSKGDADVLLDSLRAISLIDREQFAEIGVRFEKTTPRPSFNKYLDNATHIARAVHAAQWLGLQKPPVLRVLDIGSGAGYFPFVCRHYGHEAVALDTDDNEMYARLKHLLGVPCVIHRIGSAQLLPSFSARFDLITAFQITFDLKADGLLWSPAEWDAFLHHCRPLLNPGGRIVLGLNSFTRHQADGRRQNLDFFRRRGAMISLDDIVLLSPNR